VKNRLAKTILVTLLVLTFLPVTYSAATEGVTTTFDKTKGIYVDSMPYEWVPDNNVLGAWIVHDYIKNRTYFNPNEMTWRGEDFWLTRAVFRSNGYVSFTVGEPKQISNCQYTKGYVYFLGDPCIAAYEIQTVNGVDYLFLEWKSGDYLRSGKVPGYYVFTRDAEWVQEPVITGPIIDGTIPPLTTTFDKERSIYIDNLHYEWVPDNHVLGAWIVHDCIRRITDFDPRLMTWQGGGILLTHAIFHGDGYASLTFGDYTGRLQYTKGYVYFSTETIPAYEIYIADGDEYLFLEWKSGDYVRSGEVPGYYVFKRDSEWVQEPIKNQASNDSVTTPTADTPSTWAVSQVNTAIAANLVPVSLQSSYLKATTRAEFCALAVRLYENYKGVIAGRSTFVDTGDINVQKAAAIGIVNGVGGNRFDPDSPLTREQAAVLVSNLANALGRPFPRQAATFTDSNEVSSWAIEGVGQVQAAGIMSGVGNNLFSPKDSYTREQSIVTMLNVANHLSSAQSPSQSDYNKLIADANKGIIDLQTDLYYPDSVVLHRVRAFKYNANDTFYHFEFYYSALNKSGVQTYEYRYYPLLFDFPDGRLRRINDYSLIDRDGRDFIEIKTSDLTVGKTVTSRYAMYTDFPTVPDFGAYTQAELYTKVTVSPTSVGYLYHIDSFESYQFSSYVDYLYEEHSFSYSGGFTSSEGYTIMSFRKGSVNVQLGIISGYFAVTILIL